MRVEVLNQLDGRVADGRNGVEETKRERQQTAEV